MCISAQLLCDNGLESIASRKSGKRVSPVVRVVILLVVTLKPGSVKGVGNRRTVEQKNNLLRIRAEMNGIECPYQNCSLSCLFDKVWSCTMN